MKHLKGTLWRSRPGAPAIWGQITGRPGTAADVFNNKVPIVGVVRPEDTILIISEKQRFTHPELLHMHFEAVQIATPIPGWINATYFMEGSLWMEKVC